METFIYISKSASILALFYGVYFIFLRKETLFIANRHYLLIGIIVSVLMPLITFYKTVYQEIPMVLKESLTSNFIHSKTIQPIITNKDIVFNWWQIAFAIYIVGVLFFIAKFIRQLISLSAILQNNSSIKIGKHTYIKTTDTISPFSFFNFIVYNPLSHSEKELKMILKHEEVHALQWHSLDIMLCNLLVIFQWMNPIAWLYKKSVEENLEFIADHTTVQKISSKKQYQIALLQASSAYITPSIVTNFYPSFIKKRIIMLNKPTSKKTQIFKAAFILPFLALFLWSFNVEEIVKVKTVSEAKKLVSLSNPSTINKLNHIEPKQEFKTKPQNKTAPQKVFSAKKRTVKNQIQKQEEKETILTNKEFRVRITKNTSDSAFQKIKEDLKNEFAIDFNYNVQRNNAGEITSLTIDYNGSGNSGSYSVSEDNGEPIDEFTFFIDPEGKSGFYSESMELPNLEKNTRQIEREVQIMEHEHERMKSEQKRIEINEHRNHSHTVSVNIDKENNNQNNSYSVNSNEESISINKLTSNTELNKIKATLKEKGIDFNFNKLKRNKKGEITEIKIRVNNHKGSKSSTHINTNSEEAIDELFIEI